MNDFDFFCCYIITGVIVTLVASSTIREKRQNQPDGVDERYDFQNQQQGFPQQGIFGQGNFGQGSLFGQGNFGQGNFGQGNFGQGNNGQTNPGKENLNNFKLTFDKLQIMWLSSLNFNLKSKIPKTKKN